MKPNRRIAATAVLAAPFMAALMLPWFEIKFIKVIRHAIDISRTLYCIVIGKIKNWILIKFWNHWYLSVPSGSFYMLTE